MGKSGKTGKSILLINRFTKNRIMKKKPFDQKDRQNAGDGMNLVSIAKREYDGDESHTTFTQDSYFVADWSVSVQGKETISNNTLDIPNTQYYIPDWFAMDGFVFNKE